MKNDFEKKGFLQKHNLAVVTLAPLLAIFIGSMLNIWYNQTNIYERLEHEGLLVRFHTTVLIYNVSVYTVLLYIWFQWIFYLKRVRDRLRSGKAVSETELSKARAKTINIPWVVALLCVVGFLGCIPVFICSLNIGTSSLDTQVINTHLAISFLISAAICGTQAFFIAEICCLQLLYPEFFEVGALVEADGGIAGSLRTKWLVWVISTVVCPVSAELLLFYAPDEPDRNFAVVVAMIFVAFGLMSAWLAARLIIRPIHHLRSAAKKVGEGDLDAKVKLQRAADDFGMLISEFNNMVSGLKEKEHVQNMFGRHVGARAAKAILESPAGLSGTNREITAMFVDVRNFTAISESRSPEEIVELLNIFFQNMVEIVEDCNGMVNKFLGDGFMALFGAIDSEVEAELTHADMAVKCAQRMAARLREVNERASLPFEFAIGIGIHSGEAVVGSIGSQQRLEYTAIGDTVNVASRIEGLTKRVDQTILLSEATRQRLSLKIQLNGPFEERVRGKEETIIVFGADE